MKKLRWWMPVLSSLLIIAVIAMYLWSSAQREKVSRIYEGIERFNVLSDEHDKRYEDIKKLEFTIRSERVLLFLETLKPEFKVETLDQKDLQLTELERLLMLAREQNLHAVTAIADGLRALQVDKDTQCEKLAAQLLKSVDHLIARTSDALKKYRESKESKPKPPK